MITLIPAVLLLFSCASETKNAQSSSKTVGYTQLYEQVFLPTCATGPCHSGNRGVGGLSFDDMNTSYAQLIDAVAGVSSIDSAWRRVAPGSPAESLLWLKLSETEETLTSRALGAPMPMGGVQTPSTETLSVIEAWIAAGAPLDGAEFEARFVQPNTGYLRCDEMTPAGLSSCLREAEPDTTLRLESPAIEVPPFSEVVVCSEVATPEADLLVQSILAQQMVGGHHVALFVAMAPRGNGDPIDCLDEMTQYRFITAGNSKGERTSLPDGQALKVPAGETLVLQSHYINTTAETRWVMDSMDLIAPPDGSDIIITDALIINTTAIDIPAGAEDFEVTKTCRLESDLHIEQVTGHTHEHGVWFELSAQRAGEEPVRLFHSTDGPVLRDFAGFSPASIDLTTGDELTITCRWSNPGNDPLRFPREMCAGVMYYTPGVGALLCDTNDETPRPWSEVVQPGEGMGCVDEMSLGNDLGVGRHCTAGGSECAGQTANFCLATFDPTANYCSIIFCNEDSECGAEAACVAGDGGTACVPTMCQ